MSNTWPEAPSGGPHAPQKVSWVLLRGAPNAGSKRWWVLWAGILAIGMGVVLLTVTRPSPTEGWFVAINDSSADVIAQIERGPREAVLIPAHAFGPFSHPLVDGTQSGSTRRHAN